MTKLNLVKRVETLLARVPVIDPKYQTQWDDKYFRIIIYFHAKGFDNCSHSGNVCALAYFDLFFF